MEEKADPSWPSLPPNQPVEGTPACCALRRPSLATLGVTSEPHNMTDTSLNADFDAAMMSIYHRAATEAKYKASRFLSMLLEHRGLETARILLWAAAVSEVYVALWERGRIDLTVEALIYENDKWHPLFTAEELAICESRLRKYEYLK